MLHHEVEEVFFLPDRVNRNDVGMTEGARGPRLALKPLRDVRLLRDAVGDDLDRDLAVELDVVGQVDRGSSRPPELGDDLELADRRAAQEVNLGHDLRGNLVQAEAGGTEEALLPNQIEATPPTLPGSGRNRFAAARAGLHPAASAPFHRFIASPATAASLLKSRPIPGVRPSCRTVQIITSIERCNRAR